MELKKYKVKSLFRLFLKQLGIFSSLILAEFLMFILLFKIGFNSGFILPANYSEHYLERNKTIISLSEPFDELLIPHTCKYGLFDFDGNYLSGNFGDDTVKAAQNFINKSGSVKMRFFLIERSDGYCIVNYDISAHFAIPSVHKIFPRLEFDIIILFVIVFAFTVVKMALNFGKKLKKELNPLLEEINQIQNRELNINRKKSKIKEFDDILLSLYDMKIALSQSLKKEWETEQKRKDNISALAHDIKTPLTIIKGNSELISEENSIDEIYQLAEIINTNSDKIERYIKLLIDETKNNVTADTENNVNLSTLANNIISQSEALCKPNDIELIIYSSVRETEVLLSTDLIERAVLNLVKNAIEHTKDNRKIRLNLEANNNKFIVNVEDFGNGFSAEALKNAKNQFYTEKSARSDEHYGLGMYFANSVSEKYNGSVTYCNKDNKTGSVVTFEIEINNY